MEAPAVSNLEDQHQLADFEQWLVEAIHQKAIVVAEGCPSSATRAIVGARGVEYETYSVYPLTDEVRDPKKISGAVVGYEYRFGGLEIDIDHGTEGSYMSFPVAALASLTVAESVV